jgi:hypothetical protein
MELVWYIVMIFSSSGLLALEAHTHVYDNNFYILLAIIAILIKPTLRMLKTLTWLLTPVELPKPHGKLVERDLTEEEKLALRLAQIEATNTLKARQRTS